MINLGDIVRLKKPYGGYTRGIVAEIVSTFHKKISVARFGEGGVLGVTNTKDEGRAMPRNVSLYLFKPGEDGGAELLMATEHLPEFCDFHVSELVLIKKANEAGYGEKEVDIAGLGSVPGVRKKLRGAEPGEAPHGQARLERGKSHGLAVSEYMKGVGK